MLLDGPIDDRDAGIVETAKGSLLVTNFTSLAYEPIAATKNNPAWRAAHNRIEDAICREKQLKGKTRAKNVALIDSQNPEWRDLSGS